MANPIERGGVTERVIILDRPYVKNYVKSFYLYISSIPPSAPSLLLTLADIHESITFIIGLYRPIAFPSVFRNLIKKVYRTYDTERGLYKIPWFLTFYKIGPLNCGLKT